MLILLFTMYYQVFMFIIQVEKAPFYTLAIFGYA